MPFTARRGRPPKYTRPSRSITITLPEDVLAALAGVDPDIGRAIVRLAMGLGNGQVASPVEVATFGGRAVIVVSPTRTLSGMKGVELVPLADGRSLIALQDGMTEAQFELEVLDALHAADVDADDRALLERLAAVLRDARLSDTLVLRRIMVLHAVPGSPAAPANGGRRPRPTRPRRRISR